MASKEQLEILKEGVEIWNEWRQQHPSQQIDLSEADLAKMDLSGANLSASNGTADLPGEIYGANLFEAQLSETNLSDANLTGAYLVGTCLSGAILSKAKLSKTNLSHADLRGADLSGAHLSQANLHASSLSEAISDVFLKGCGVPDSFIEYARSLARTPIEFFSCFISYSSRNQQFADRLYTDLQDKGVRCWFAPEDIKIGDKFRIRIDESIRLYDKLLLVLSQHSVSSDWVEKEVETAMERERQEKRTVLFPIRLDDAVMNIPNGWPADIRRSRHIGDFTKWKNHDDYQNAFTRLLRDLKAGMEVGNA